MDEIFDTVTDLRQQKPDKTDAKFMRSAILEAKKAIEKKEIPVGAVVVLDGKIVARGHNLRVNNLDPTAHAEVVALRKAAKKLGRWNLSDCQLFVTLEPCVMCAGAIVNSRIQRVVFGAFDDRFGCCGTLANLAGWSKLNHRAEVAGGVLSEECGAILTDYFKKLRQQSKKGQAIPNNL